MQINRHLITTCDERTWVHDRPVLFLGEWCNPYDRSAIWTKMDAKFAAPYGVEPDKKTTDTKYVQALSTKLLLEVVDALNAYHNTNHTPRYWNILLGHWLKRCVSVCFNRYFTIEQALKNYKITSATVFDPLDYSLATPDTLKAIWACSDDVWNTILYARVLQHMDCKDVVLDIVHIESAGACKQKQSSMFTMQDWSVRRLVKAVGYYILPILSKNGDAFIVNSYLPLWQEMKLQFALWQCPEIWQSPPLKSSFVDKKIRRKFKINSKKNTDFEKFIRDILPDMIPVCFLEGYSLLNQQVESLSWPNTPKFIFTSNNFDTDEIFKAWTGLKVEQGVPYFTGQHGNYQAIPRLLDSPEVVSCDNFFTWGWSNGNIKNIPAFAFKIANRQNKTKPSGGLLLIELSPPNQTYLHDAFYEYSVYQEQQFRFVEALPQKIQKKLTVRLSVGWRNYRWSPIERWNDRIPSVSLETGDAPIRSLIAKSRLVVHSYDSTGVLEGLGSNTPTLCFWDGGLDHLLPSVKPYYERLRQAGILADTPEHAAQLVSKYWDNLDGWWSSEKVQSARRQFCEEYARIEKHPVRTMKRLLTTAVLDQNNLTKNNA